MLTQVPRQPTNTMVERGAELSDPETADVIAYLSKNFGQVNVQFTGTSGGPQIVPQVGDKAHCPASGNAWYYDNPKAPTEIVLCTATCGAISVGGELDVLTGCETVTR